MKMDILATIRSDNSPRVKARSENQVKPKNAGLNSQESVDETKERVHIATMPVLGSVPHLNARPLLEGLEKATGSVIHFDSPVQLHEKVLSGKIQIALLPVISYLENRDLKLVPGTGIVSHGEVKSVKVFHEKSGVDLANTQSIYLDPSSKTSQRLLKVLLVKKYNRKLDEILWTDRPDYAESVLSIGDHALANSHFGNSTDLGLEWQKLTGLPFVYACWMSQIPIPQELLAKLHNAKMTGLQSIDEIAARQTVVPHEDAVHYLTHHIQYHIEGPELVGMKMFFDWVVELENQGYDTSLRFVA
jgi:Predicted periplasmic solute-binding protein